MKEEELSEELITKKELARRLKVSERKIETDSELPCVRWGAKVLYDWGDVLSYLKDLNSKKEETA